MRRRSSPRQPVHPLAEAASDVSSQSILILSPKAPLAIERHPLRSADVLILQDIDKKSNYMKSKHVMDAGACAHDVRSEAHREVQVARHARMDPGGMLNMPIKRQDRKCVHLVERV